MMKKRITKNIDRSILAPSPCGEGWGGAFEYSITNNDYRSILAPSLTQAGGRALK
jgi:hypothetical protein